MQSSLGPCAGVYTSRQAERSGLDDRALRRAVARGDLVRLRRGAFVDGEVWAAADEAERDRLRIVAFCAGRGFRDVVSHDSAAILHGLPRVGPATRTVHVTDTAARSTRPMGELLVHAAPLDESETTRMRGVGDEGGEGIGAGAGADVAGAGAGAGVGSGVSAGAAAGLGAGSSAGAGAGADGDGPLRVTTIVRTLVDLLQTWPFREGVAVLDEALRLELVSRDRIGQALWSSSRQVGSATARRVFDFADAGAGSVAESLSRVAIAEAGFAAPVLQQKFTDEQGLIGFTDFWWPRVGIVGEFDGHAKYERAEYLRGRTPAQVFDDEKRRERRLRQHPLVRDVVRWGWRDLEAPGALARILASAGVRQLEAW